MSADSTSAGSSRPVVTIRDLRKSFGEREVLKGIDVQVHAGEVVCVIGPSGSGKSTLLRCVNLLEQPTSGTVELLGAEVTDPDVDIDRVRTHVGMVFQQFNLFSHRTVLDNCTMAQRTVLRRSRAEAERVALANLERVGLADRARAMPAQLSGGQQQRVALARALVTRPEVIFADEPTGALDSTTGAEVLALLRRSVDEWGQTVVMVTHDANAAAVADRVILLADGQVAGEILDPEVDAVLAAVRDLGRA